MQHVVEPSAVLQDPNGTGVKIEHRAQTWATALHGKWLRQSVGGAVAKHTWRGVREVGERE